MATLQRTLGLWSLVFYGVGMIVGAGVYSVIGEAAGPSGDALWMAFLVGAVVAVLTGLSYAELGTLFPRAGAEYVYVREAFPRRRAFPFAIGIVLVAAASATAATVSLAFAGYLETFVSAPRLVAALAVVLVLTGVNLWGIRLSSRVNVVFTLLEVGGLVAFTVLGATSPSFGEALLAAPHPGVIQGATLLFFAYLGFEDIVNLAEEAKDPARDLPRAIFVALAVTGAIYVAVGLSAVALAEPTELAQSDSPLVLAARRVSPALAGALGGVALFATANTALIALVAGSRMLFGIAREGDLPAAAASVLPGRRTPWVAALCVAGLACALVPLGDVSAVASLSSFAALLAFVGVNLSLIVLRYRAPSAKRPFRVPVSVGRFPVLAGAALLLAGGLLAQFDAATWTAGGVGIGVALAAHFLTRGPLRRRRREASSE
jgi:amino acid transporter